MKYVDLSNVQSSQSQLGAALNGARGLLFWKPKTALWTEQLAASAVSSSDRKCINLDRVRARLAAELAFMWQL